MLKTSCRSDSVQIGRPYGIRLFPRRNEGGTSDTRICFGCYDTVDRQNDGGVVRYRTYSKLHLGVGMERQDQPLSGPRAACILSLSQSVYRLEAPLRIAVVGLTFFSPPRINRANLAFPLSCETFARGEGLQFGVFAFVIPPSRTCRNFNGTVPSIVKVCQWRSIRDFFLRV